MARSEFHVTNQQRGEHLPTPLKLHVSEMMEHFCLKFSGTIKDIISLMYIFYYL